MLNGLTCALMLHLNSDSGILTAAVVPCTAPCQHLSGSAVLSSSLCVWKKTQRKKTKQKNKLNAIDTNLFSREWIYLRLCVPSMFGAFLQWMVPVVLNNAKIKVSGTPVKYIYIQNREQQLQFFLGEVNSLREWLQTNHTTTQGN